MRLAPRYARRSTTAASNARWTANSDTLPSTVRSTARSAARSRPPALDRPLDRNLLSRYKIGVLEPQQQFSNLVYAGQDFVVRSQTDDFRIMVQLDPYDGDPSPTAPEFKVTFISLMGEAPNQRLQLMYKVTIERDTKFTPRVERCSLEEEGFVLH